MQESKSEFAERRWQFYALRDFGIVAVTLLCWWGAQSIGALGIIAGIGLGMSAYLFHEWAHLLAAMRRKVSVEFATRWYAIFLFNMRIGGSRRGRSSRSLSLVFLRPCYT